MSTGRALPDVNVLVALAWPNHVHHEVAHEWFAGLRSGFATTPITGLGFVRVSSNPKVAVTGVSTAAALGALEGFTNHTAHAFWADDVPPSSEPVPGTHGQVTDAHLVALARRHGGHVATLDRRLVALGPTSVLLLTAPDP